MKSSLQVISTESRLFRNARIARQEFHAWASLFSGRLFVKIAAYIDESGTHDKTGVLKGSSAAVMVGLVAWREEWVDFCGHWQNTLNSYGAPYFHFCEWNIASRVARGKMKRQSRFKKNPYRDWSVSKLDDFLYELAEIAGSGNKVTVGGWINTAEFHKAKTTKGNAPAGGDPYRHLTEQFFVNFIPEIQSVWKYWTEPVSLFFDQSDDPKWCAAIHDAFNACRKRDNRLREISFADKTLPPHLPLQAADMSVYRFRQLAENASNGTLRLVQPLPKLDDLLLKGMFSQLEKFGHNLKSRACQDANKP